MLPPLIIGDNWHQIIAAFLTQFSKTISWVFVFLSRSTSIDKLTDVIDISIHKALFTGIFDNEIAGKVRTYDIVKKEPILNGDTVIYGRADSIMETLDYDFKQEKEFQYKGLTKREKVEHLVKFVAAIWQIHPFAEGNTRTTAVLIIKYLYTLGFENKNDLFEKYALYFRNALVRANYQNLEADIPYTMEYLIAPQTNAAQISKIRPTLSL